MLTWHEAIDEMYKGNVVRYIGTLNGNVMTDRGGKFCMCRGVLFSYVAGAPVYKSDGAMVYDPDFRYELTGETVDTRYWPNKQRKVLDNETVSELGYSRIGRNNV